MPEKNITFSYEVFAPNIEPRIRHPKIFEVFESLESGEFMLLVNDHDPRPLHYQFIMERDGEFSWKYIQEGPDCWKVAIGRK